MQALRNLLRFPDNNNLHHYQTLHPRKALGFGRLVKNYRLCWEMLNPQHHWNFRGHINEFWQGYLSNIFRSIYREGKIWQRLRLGKWRAKRICCTWIRSFRF